MTLINQFFSVCFGLAWRCSSETAGCHVLAAGEQGISADMSAFAFCIPAPLVSSLVGGPTSEETRTPLEHLETCSTHKIRETTWHSSPRFLLSWEVSSTSQKASSVCCLLSPGGTLPSFYKEACFPCSPQVQFQFWISLLTRLVGSCVPFTSCWRVLPAEGTYSSSQWFNFPFPSSGTSFSFPHPQPRFSSHQIYRFNKVISEQLQPMMIGRILQNEVPVLLLCYLA